jgi:hypothetical protein
VWLGIRGAYVPEVTEMFGERITLFGLLVFEAKRLGS